MQIILLPGLLCDASVWTAQVEALRLSADVVVADFAAHDSITAMASAALGLREGPLVVVGHSMGARVALEMVRLAPGRVERLALLDTGAHPRREGEEVPRQELVDLADARGMAALADRWLPPMVHEARIDDPALMEPLRAMVLRATPEQHRRQIRALLDRPDARPLLPTIACPTLVMVGRRDAFRAEESAYLDRFGLTQQEKNAVMARDWREMVRLGGNLFFILKISAVDPVRITEIGAHQAGMDHDAFLRDRLGKK